MAHRFDVVAVGIREKAAVVVLVIDRTRSGRTVVLATRGQTSLVERGHRIAVSRGKAVIWIDNASGQDPAITPFMMESLLTTAKYAEANPDVVRALVKATRRAVKEIQAKSAPEIMKVVQGEFTKFKPPVMLLGIEAVKPALNGDGRVTIDMARKTLLLDGRTEVSPEALFGTFTDKYMR